MNLERKLIKIRCFKNLLLPINLILILFLLFLLLSSVSPVLNSISRFILSFFALGFSITIVAKRKSCELNLFELMMDSIFISILASVGITLVLALLELNNIQNYYIVQLALILFSSVITVKVNPKFKIKYGKAELLLSIFLVSVFISLNVNSDKFYTPDEYFYLRGSLDFIRYNYLTSISYIPLRSFSDVLVGRFLWQITLAAFIEATSGLLPYYAINLPFFTILLSAILSLLKLLFGKNNKMLLSLWLIVALNPLIFVLSHFVLIDFALASLSLFSIYWFIKAFKSESNVDINSLVKCFMILLISLLYKFNLILPATLWITFVFFFLKNKFYRLSKWHKSLFLIVTLPVMAYELFLDIPALFTYYVLHDLQLNFLFARYVFFSPLGTLVNFFFKTPWTFRTWFDIPDYEKLFFFFNILPPELMTPIISSFAILSFLVLRKNYKAMMLAYASLIALFIAFIGFLSSGNYYDIQRDMLAVILLLQIIGLTSFSVSLNGREHFVYASIVLMLLTTYFEYIVLANKNITSYLWGTKPENMFDRLLLMNMLISIPIFLIMISDAKLLLRLNKIKLGFTFRTLMLILLFSLLLTNSIDLTSYSLRNNTYFLDHGMSDLASQANNLEGKTLVMSNAYALPLYTSHHPMFISPPLSFEELNSFLKAGIKSRLIVSNDIITTWISYIMGSNEYLQALPPIITSEEETSKTPEPLFDGSKNILFHLSCINSSEIRTPLDNKLNMTIIGSPIWEDRNRTRVMHFDGVDDYITISGKSLLSPLQKLTVEVWFSTERPQNGKFLVMGGYDNGTYVWGVYLSTNSTAMSFYIKGQKIYNLIIRGNFNDGFWHHFVGVFDGKSITIYFEGKPVKSMILEESAAINPSDHFKIYIGSWSGRSAFDGYIGFVNVYADVFEPSDVIEQYIKAQGEGTGILAKVVSTTVNYVVFDVYGKDIHTFPTPDITVKNVNIRPVKVGDSFTHTGLSIDFYAKKSFNGTLILNTYYFSKFQHIEVKEGYNHIELTFPNKIDSKAVGVAIGQKTEILILSNDGGLLAETVAASTVLKGLALLYMLLPIILLLLLYTYISSKESKIVS